MKTRSLTNNDTCHVSIMFNDRLIFIYNAKSSEKVILRRITSYQITSLIFFNIYINSYILWSDSQLKKPMTLCARRGFGEMKLNESDLYRQMLLALGEARKTILWPTPGFKEWAIDSWEFYGHGTAVFSYAAPHGRGTFHEVSRIFPIITFSDWFVRQLFD